MGLAEDGDVNRVGRMNSDSYASEGNHSSLSEMPSIKACLILSALIIDLTCSNIPSVSKSYRPNLKVASMVAFFILNGINKFHQLRNLISNIAKITME